MNTGLTTLTVTEDQADARLDRYLRRHVEGLSQAMIQKLCRTGKIRIDGKKAEASTHVPLGAAGSSKRALKVNSPALTINWLIGLFSRMDTGKRVRPIHCSRNTWKQGTFQPEGTGFGDRAWPPIPAGRRTSRKSRRA